MDWYEQTFGACPHGYIKPYCGQCASDEVTAAAEESRERQSGRASEKRLAKTVVAQSSALDAADAHIRRLERQLADARRGRRG